MRAKQLEKEMHDQVDANLSLINHAISDYFMLPGSCVNILRNDGPPESSWDDDDFTPQAC
ncbi:hypothetical protein PR202_ga16830 [Eleusine coracana subsp. coracana]|uniref:Uncharacterized protein n=1 Tax=Eleusine coracana subsp. coracana TaxID=191504 RepID=A0AAV5CNA1_ELECO|nr:hypothetical protein PR202_ga16830 [Eleusine coracana subsp. coracana]